MSHLFAAILLLSSPGCPHEEPSCITPTEYVEVNLSFSGDASMRSVEAWPSRLRTLSLLRSTALSSRY